MAHALDLTLIADGQADGQWQSSNDGLTQLANSVGDIMTVDFSGGNVSLSNDEFRRYLRYIPSGLSTSRDLTVPAIKRPLFVVDNTDAADTITVKCGATSFAVAPGLIGYMTTDGTTDGLRGSISGSGSTGAVIGKQTIWIPASAMAPATTNGCAALAQLETATNDINYGVLDFDDAADEHAHFNIAFPKSWNEGTITFQVWWSSTATDTDGVAWGLQAVAISDNEALDAAWGTAIVVTDDAQSATDELYITSESAALTIAGTPAANDLVFFRIFRDVSDANDDMTEDARLIGVKIFYTVDAGNDS
jgi:hypothetical protein